MARLARARSSYIRCTELHKEADDSVYHKQICGVVTTTAPNGIAGTDVAFLRLRQTDVIFELFRLQVRKITVGVSSVSPPNGPLEEDHSQARRSILLAFLGGVSDITVCFHLHANRFLTEFICSSFFTSSPTLLHTASAFLSERCEVGKGFGPPSSMTELDIIYVSNPVIVE